MFTFITESDQTCDSTLPHDFPSTGDEDKSVLDKLREPNTEIADSLNAFTPPNLLESGWFRFEIYNDINSMYLYI